MRNLLLILLVLAPFFSEGQKRMKKKVSYAQGTIFGYWGYNRSAYTKSNMRFVGPGYDFTLAGAVAHDNPEKVGAVYFDPSRISIPQFNARIGYYFKDHWAISFGYDHMKYIFADKNEVTLSGKIDPGVDNNWSGTYSAEPVITDRKVFHYENSDGLNYLRFELTRTDQWLKVGNKDWFAFSTNVGIAAGGLLSFNDFTFAQQKSVRTISMSGYGVSAHLGARFEFLRHVFIETKLGGGLNHQLKVRNRQNDPSAYTRQAYGYASFETVVGFLLYIRPKNGCDSCPNW
tara:strand:- start:20104 stop:20967 length:864 start_codon:yes stop_codon:yes gene_type:complete